MKPIMVRSTDARQAAALDQLEIEPGRRKAGAAGDQKMGDARALGAELRGARPPACASSGACRSKRRMRAAVSGKVLAPIEAVGVEASWAVRRRCGLRNE